MTGTHCFVSIYLKHDFTGLIIKCYNKKLYLDLSHDFSGLMIKFNILKSFFFDLSHDFTGLMIKCNIKKSLFISKPQF